MIGLLLKDLYALRPYFTKQISFMVLFLIGIQLFLVQSAANFSIMIIMIVYMMLFSSFSLDDAAHWNSYALTLPLSNKTIVRGKYLLFLSAMFISCVTSFLISFLFDLLLYHEGVLLIAGMSFSSFLAFVLFASVTLPLFFRFPSEKARSYMRLITLVPCFLLFAGLTYFSNSLEGFFTVLTSIPLPWILIASTSLVTACFIGSYFLSVQFFKKQEF